jgi:pentapeptide repeat protein
MAKLEHVELIRQGTESILK